MSKLIDRSFGPGRWPIGHRAVRAAAAVAVVAMVAAHASAETWDNTSTDFDWDTPTNWNPDTVPGSGSTATFSSNAAGVIGTIDLEGQAQSIDALQFTHGSGLYTIGTAIGDGSLTLNQLTKTGGGNLTINSGLIGAGSALTLNVSNQTTTIAGTVTATNLTKGGDNTLVLSNLGNAISGTLTVGSGTVDARGVGSLGPAGSAAIAMSGGTLSLRSTSATPNPLVWGNNVTITGNASINVDAAPSTSGSGITQRLGNLSIGGQQLSFGNGSNQRLSFVGTTLSGNATFSNAGGISLGALDDGGVARTITVTGGSSNNGGFNLDTAAASLTAGGTLNVVNGATVSLATANAWNSTINVTGGTVNYNVNDALANGSAVNAIGTSTGSNTVGQVVVNSAVSSFGNDTVSIASGNVLQINSNAATGLTRGSNLTLAPGAIVSETAANQLTAGTPIANLGTSNDLMLGLSNGITQSVTVGNAGGTTPWMGISTDALSDRQLNSGSVITVAAGASQFTLQGVNNRVLAIASGVTINSASASTANLVGRINLNNSTAGAYNNVTLLAKAATANSAGSEVTLNQNAGSLPGAVALNVEGANAIGLNPARITSITNGAINGSINVQSGAASNLPGGQVTFGNNNLFNTTTQGTVTVNVGGLVNITQQQAINNGPGSSVNELVLATDATKPYQGPIVQVNTGGLNGTGQIARTGTGAVIWQLGQSGALSGAQLTPGTIQAGDIVRLSADNITNLSNVTGAAIYEIINDRNESTNNSNINLNGGMLVTDQNNRVVATTGGINVGSAGGTFGAPNAGSFRISAPVLAAGNALTLGVNAVIDPIQQNSATKIKDGLIRFNTDGAANTVTAGSVTLAVGSAEFTSGANSIGSYTSNSTGKTFASNGTTGSALGTASVLMNAGILATGGNGSSTGTLAGLVSAGSGAHTFAPGDLGGIGTLNLAAAGSSLSLNGLSTLHFDINGTTEASDLLVLTGTLDISGGTPSIALQTFGGTLDSETYTLATFADSAINQGSFNLPAAPFGYAWSVSSTGIQLTTAAVPEPSGLGLLALGAARLLKRRRATR
ncbi:MAG TPA: hypothetical protein VGN72_03215 [Tepidisphaeraceae bacterium]|nr:hypothetical protein [Tepidisphaeraceae bacterium]